MPSELDPLLPHNDASPEIIPSGDGKVKRVAEDGDATKVPDRTNTLSLRNLVAILTFVVGTAVVITWLSPSAERGSSPSLTTPAGHLTGRVNKILSSNPLIGNYQCSSIILEVLF